jgi:FdhE protein
VANRFVSRIFGSASENPPEVKEALAELERLAARRPELSGPSALLTELLPVLFDKPDEVTALVLPAEHAAAKLAAGLPLLRGEPLVIDVRAFRKRWQQICAVMERHQKRGAAQRVSEILRGARWSAGELVGEMLAGQTDSIAQRAGEFALDADTVLSVLRLTMYPLMVSWSQALAELRQGTPWRHGYCPTCGSWPLLAEFRGLEQLRFLRCGLCAAEWEFPRLLCPFCGARDHEQLGYLHVEGEETKQRAATCENCHGYVKTLSTLATLSPPQLLVTELATTHLDLIASERGYTAQP